MRYDTLPTRRRGARTSAALAITLVGAAFVGLTGCANIERSTRDVWSVTYEVSVDGPVDTPLSTVKIFGAGGRSEDPKTEDLGTVTTTDAGDDGASIWRRETMVPAKDHGIVRATPPADRTATCRVLLDGQREIASVTSAAPGEEVTCDVVTPEFKK